ncbi:uncharacterized protein LOC109603335 isoform X2 [Aethina tumida]|uniref:uncharacterized protein LOC109603335 isoform X2 n=1 Tax=Aethina tumida TaxID=116153 RepID=UPI0021475C54|nr:uncharacterized protein LOC109603335 isoform X2 [Aethina tumida]
METPWKLLSLCLGLLLFQLCNGFPINSESTPSDSHSQLLTGLVAVLLTVCSVVFLAGCLCCQRRNGFKEFRDSPVVASTASNLDHGHVNPIANGEFTIFTPLSPPHQNNNVFLANQQIIARTRDDYSYGDVDVSDWFSESEKDFPRIKLKYIRELGRGWFGKVVEGAAQDIGNGEDKRQWTPVVVRILEASASSKERVIFLHDATIYRCGSHPNLLSLIGRCLDTIPLLILQEFCPQGDLKKYLRQNKSKSENSILSTEYPLIWCCQLTSALKFLHENNVTHPDLASRNCQLTANLTLKLGDYGMGLQRYPQDYYQGSPGLPVRWCAPESLVCTSTTIQPCTVTKESNVWSLGVTLWEICECGDQPYSQLTDDEVLSQVLGSPNVRLSRPTFTVLYTDYIYRLMQLCWTNAESRPSVAQIDLMLADLLQVHKNANKCASSESTDDFERRWESLKPNNIVHTQDINSSEGDVEIQITKPLSPSLNNLHGSLDNFLIDNEPDNNWYQNSSTSDELFSSNNLNDTTEAAIGASNSKPEISKPIEFKLGPAPPQSDQSTLSESLSGSIMNRSSESETEDENWKRKVELGAYTEKVRLKSKSVADLMVLTHIDYSESESETPLPSLDYRSNYKNVRYPLKTNLENVSLTFGSEGNLLNVQDNFEDELRKLHEERRDSLLFVPDKHSQNISLYQSKPLDVLVTNISANDDSPNKRLMQELNSGSEIKPASQVYNVFNVTIDKFSPLHVNSTKLQKIINLQDPEDDIPLKLNHMTNLSTDTRISNVTYLNAEKLELNQQNSLLQNFSREDTKDLKDDDVVAVPTLENAQPENIETNITQTSNLGTVSNTLQVPTLVEIIQNRDDLMEFIVANYSYDSIDEDVNETISEKCVEENTSENVKEGSESLENVPSDLLNNGRLDTNSVQINEDNTITNSDNFSENAQKSVLETDNDEEHVLNLEETNESIPLEMEEKASGVISNDESQTSESGDKSQYESCTSHIDDTTNIAKPKVEFDLSSSQKGTLPNPLTHSSVFSSTPYRKKNLDLTQSLEDTFSSLNLYECVKPEEDCEVEFSSNFAPLENEYDGKNFNYSLETWDNFLGKTMDDQSKEDIFDSFTSEPQSLLFLENNDEQAVVNSNEADKSNEYEVTEINETFVVNNDKLKTSDEKDGTFVLNDTQKNDGTFTMEDTKDTDQNGTWGAGGGWFLHPQTSNEDVSGEITIAKSDSDSYVGFSMDDEIMAAIRNELLSKLPHAQGTSNENVKEEEEWENGTRNEVFLRYNVYNTPLSPIPEESLIDDCSEETTPRRQSLDESYISDSDEEQAGTQQDTETPSAHQSESPIRGRLHRHTPSQDSCCSNDTLFNLEELTTNDPENQPNKSTEVENTIANVADVNVNKEESNTEKDEEDKPQNGETSNSKYLEDFIQSERESSSLTLVKVTEAPEEISSESVSSDTDHLLPFIKQFVPPLPSPEDKPWKQLPASMLSYDKVIFNAKESKDDADDLDLNKEKNESQDEDVEVLANKDNIYDSVNNTMYENIENIQPNYENVPEKVTYENIDTKQEYENLAYENIDNVNDIYNEADYVNIVNFENSKNSADFNKISNEESKNVNYDQHDELIINDDEETSNLFGVLTDIRFNGPGDSQFMSTSFSESNDNDEQDWDSGSDTRSSSSGEFIWKLDDIKPMEGIEEEEVYSDSSISSGSTSGDEGETPEFVPSAWDKYATPTKSALRSPEKTLERDEKKAKGVWFKKQKYHCVYEYPREPDSPVLQSQDLWKPQSDFTDWDFDADTYLPTLTADNDILSLNTYTYQPPNYSKGRNLYDLTDISEPSNLGNEEFFISSSSKPFDMISSLSSQFFPGSSQWTVENMTPDSGMEDITPASLDDYPTGELRKSVVPPLKVLASEAANPIKKFIKGNDSLGGLRHTRNKLKLDLPPSPSAFTTGKMFTVEPSIEPVVLREKPTFSTFGKSRFLVQQVDTPPDGTTENKNVSFEALPYKPLNNSEALDTPAEKQADSADMSPELVTYPSIKSQIIKDVGMDETKCKVEFVRGEASLLDSADEDSGIESSTLERKLSNTT